MSIESSEPSTAGGTVSLVPWRRYGHDRVDVHVDGSSVGYLDRTTGQVHVDAASRNVVIAALKRGGHAVGAIPAERRQVSPTFRPYKEAAAHQQDARRAARREGRLRSFAERSWREPTLSEKALADALVSISPFVWQREYRIDPYRLDFFCASARLAVEVDGSSHRRRRDDDAPRDALLEAVGILTMRIDARDVEKDCGAVVARINRRCIERTGQVPATDKPAPGVVNKLLRRRVPVERPALAPPQFARGLKRGAFVCARCRQEKPGCERSVTRTNCCVFCEL